MIISSLLLFFILSAFMYYHIIKMPYMSTKKVPIRMALILE